MPLLSLSVFLSEELLKNSSGPLFQIRTAVGMFKWKKGLLLIWISVPLCLIFPSLLKCLLTVASFLVYRKLQYSSLFTINDLWHNTH